MAYRLIKGEYHIFYPDQPNNGPQPDGDTLKFKPNNPALVSTLQQNGGSPGFNNRGMINIRFEAIDALETHFDGSHQDLQWALAARDFVLSETGFQNVTFKENSPNKVESVDNNPRPGYILAKDLDTFGRIIGFVFAGDTDFPDGSDIFVDKDDLLESLNLRLLKEGLVYPAFYTSLPRSLRIFLAGFSKEAREAGRGLWPKAKTDEAIELANGDVLEGLVFWPKLFRRLVRYFGEGNEGLANFDNWIREDSVDRDDTLLLPPPFDGELSNMHDTYEIVGDTLRIKFDFEDIVIAPDGVIPANNNNTGTQTPNPADQPIRIVGVLPNPEGADRGNETVTLLNLSPNAIDLAGWSITDKQRNGAVDLTNMGPLVAGDTLQVTMTNAVQLSNSGDEVVLLDNLGNVVHQVAYTGNQAKKAGWTLVF